MARDETLEFIKSFADRFVQFKGLQFQQELLRRREKRYDTQLQENRRYRQRQLSMSQEHLKLRERYVTAVEENKLRTNINLAPFSKADIVGTSQTQGVDDIIAEELSNVPMDTSDWLGWGEGTNIYKQSDIDAARQKAQERVRVMFAGKGGGGEQFDYLWNSQLGELKNPESGRNVEIREQEADKADIFQGTQPTPPPDEPSGATFPRKYGPVGRIPGEKEPVFGEIPPLDQPDFARIEQSLGKEKAQMEQKAWQVIYNTWRFFPKQLQDAISAKQQQGVSFTEIMQFDEVDQFLQGLVK